MTVFLAVGAIVAALVLDAVVLGVLGAIAAVAYNIWAWNRAELFPISTGGAAAARRANWLVSALAFLAILIS